MDLTEEEIERVNKYLLNAYIELCRAEKFLKSLDSKGEKNNYDSSK